MGHLLRSGIGPLWTQGKWAHPSQKWDGEGGLHPCLVPQSLEGKTAPTDTSQFSL